MCELAGRREAGEVRPGQNSGGRGAWPLCIVLLGAGWWRLVPASAPAPTLSGLAIVPPMAGVRAPSPAPPRTPAHYCRGSIVSGDGRQPPVHTAHYTLHTAHYTLHTATLASADHTAPPVVTRLTSTQHQTHCEVRSSAAWWRGPARPCQCSPVAAAAGTGD